jgi:hypothetical protein
MNVGSPHEILQANSSNFDAYTTTKHDPWQKYRILMLDVHSLSEFPKVTLNFLINISKCWVRVIDAPIKVLTKQRLCMLWVKLLGYWWRWSRMTKHTYLTKLWNFECMSSNLSSRLIRGSFGWGCVSKCIPRRLKFDWFANE